MKNGHPSFKKVDSNKSSCRLDMNYMFFLIDPPVSALNMSPCRLTGEDIGERGNLCSYSV